MSETADLPDPETLKEHYEKAKRLTANEIVSKGDGNVHGLVLLDQMGKQQQAREKKAKDSKSKKQAKAIAFEA
jgi:hypothetical protein